MKFHLITLFPEACEAYLGASIIGRARKEKKISVAYQNPRDFVDNKWGKVDERPYGGGPGMVMQAMPIVGAGAGAPKGRGGGGGFGGLGLVFCFFLAPPPSPLVP